MSLSGAEFPEFEPDSEPHPQPESVVLLVEDEDSLGELLVDLLARMNLRVLRAVDGETALRLFAAEADVIAMAMIDCLLPDMNGCKLAQKLRLRSPSLPLLLTSGRDHRGAVKALGGSGPTAFLQKPYMPADISRQVNALLSRSL